jgi:hypothetical protein
LDLGAGVGALTAAFVEEVLGRERKPRSLHLTVWEGAARYEGPDKSHNGCYLPPFEEHNK